MLSVECTTLKFHSGSGGRSCRWILRPSRQISVGMKRTLHPGPGMGFGETALLYSCPRVYSCPRAATVRVRGECDLRFMDRRAFRAIMASHKMKRLNMKPTLLELEKTSFKFKIAQMKFVT
mmetsp:Transcript_7660/g.13336  ORF Transcript_7660/g.13336 Transcript_7660/m.13336 type:complete len:121 (-) Transcript_7660:428-790(-)